MNQKLDANSRAATLSVAQQLRGAKLVVIGGTGFLGKVFWVMLLARFPDIEKLYLVVRAKAGQSAEQRFWSEIAASEALEPLREAHGDGYDQFLRDKIVPIKGDVSLPMCGLEPDVRDEIRGLTSAVINSAGVVDFDPPLDEALKVNAFGIQNLCELTRDLQTKLMHTSTCYVAGSRTGFIEEDEPTAHPFPRVAELEAAHWDPDAEIAECLDVIEQARHRGNDAFRQSRFLDEAKANLAARGEPAQGKVLEDEIARVKRKFVEARLAEMGTERAQFWGWANTYTYTKSIGEQIIYASGLDYTIVRPAIIESSVSFPCRGWCEGINTSAPLIYALREGQTQIPGSDNYLDFIPCDMVAGAMILSLAELLEGTAPHVYQYGSSDTNPCTMRRFFELSGLYKRQYYNRTGRGGPVVSTLQAHFEGAMLSKQQFHGYGPLQIAKGVKTVSKWLKKSAVGPTAPLLKPAAKALAGFADGQQKVGSVLNQFIPFTADFSYVFRCDNTRAAYARLSDAERELIQWEPTSIDWRDWFLNVHIPGLEKRVFPLIDERIARDRPPPKRHETLPALLDQMAERFELAVALQRTEEHGLSRLSFQQWRERSLGVASRLVEAGVSPGDHVLLAGANHPAWPISFFGILYAGATVVPLDPDIDGPTADTLQRAADAKVAIGDGPVRKRLEPPLEGRVQWLDLNSMVDAAAAPGFEPVATQPSSVAALIFTSGTTGSPKGVMLAHENLTALVASLAPLFPLKKGDRVLSVLPLHHTFELTCGMLLPLSRGARIVYLDELTADRLEVGLKSGRITAMVGVPALWEMLERRIVNRIAEHGVLASRLFETAVELNRTLGKNFGVDAGKLMFGPVHEALGGHLRYLVSGGAALPEATHNLFSGVGLHLAEGYGLTEASPVLTVAKGGPKARAGHVGKPIPGVEIRIDSPNEAGVGEVLARGPNVMLGYLNNAEATGRSIGEDGWLRTGDLGKLDRRGQLEIVGRSKDTIVTSSGENIYPDDVEARLGKVENVEELALVGIAEPRGGERLACVAVPESNDAHSREHRQELAKTSLRRAFANLPVVMRPAVLTLVDAPLPRTATRKVRRNEVRRMIERVAPLSDRAGARRATSGTGSMVRAAAALIARRDPSELTADTTLRGDLGFDSLMLLELLVSLEGQTGRTVDADRLSECETIGEAEAVLRSVGVRRVDTKAIEKEPEAELELPQPVRDAAMQWLGRGQMNFYEKVLQTEVTGRANIPFNRNVLIAANHASHLDMGLVKYALGSYGSGMVALAAQDYFFEGGKWRKAYFDNLTNLVPMSRQGSLRQSLRKAGELLKGGKNVLVFPEGTRSTSGQLAEFKPAVGHIALQSGVDILPVWLGNTHLALPKGAVVLRRRDVKARIGPPLTIGELRRLTDGLSMTEASRAVARLTERAVSELSRGRSLDISRLHSLEDSDDSAPPSMADVFRELEGRFQAGAVSEPVSFYFSLGDGERWTIRVTEGDCVVRQGKAAEPADCVLKTSRDMFERIVRQAYTPTPDEFIAGVVKSNNINLLVTFQKVFALVDR